MKENSGPSAPAAGPPDTADETPSVPATVVAASDGGEPSETAAQASLPLSPSTRGEARARGRWWPAVGAGLVIAAPFAWLLSYAATLPFFLGLFFFVLFGLVIGAVMHRVASPARPYAQGTLLVGTTVVVVFCWLGSLFNESRDFPKDMATLAVNRTRDLGDRSADEFRAAVAADVRRYLRERYPPGGMLGYTRWVLTQGRLEAGEVTGVTRTLEPRQAGFLWAVRVVLSIALLAYGVGSQTLPLSQERESTIRAMDDQAG